MKKILLIMSCLLLVTLCGCGNDKPSSVIKNFHSYIASGRYEEAAKLTKINRESVQNDNFFYVAEKAKQYIDSHGGVKEIVILNEVITQSNAFYVIDIKLKDGIKISTRDVLIIENGKWKVEFN